MKQLHKLNQSGFTHHAVLAAFVVVFAVAGVAYLVAGHAQKPPNPRNFYCTSNTYSVDDKHNNDPWQRHPKQNALCVRAIQYTVGKRPVNGKYDYKTSRYVSAFQVNNGLTNDGKVGPKTWNKLCSRLNYLASRNLSAGKYYLVISGCRRT